MPEEEKPGELLSPLMCIAHAVIGPLPPTEPAGLADALANGVPVRRVYCGVIENHIRHEVHAEGRIYRFEGDHMTVMEGAS